MGKEPDIHNGCSAWLWWRAADRASVNRNERYGYAVDNMDILVVGHSHKPVLTKPQKIYIDPQNRKVSFKPFNVVQATSCLEYGGYALRKQLCRVRTPYRK